MASYDRRRWQKYFEAPISTVLADISNRIPLSAQKQGTTDYLQLLESAALEVHRFVSRQVPDDMDAADIAQQTLLVACSKLHTFRGQNFRAWLFAIARNLIIDRHRMRSRLEFLDPSPAFLAETESALQTAPDSVHDLCECRERLRCWLHCMANHLCLEEQLAVLLADMHGYRDRDSARLLHIPLPSFKLLLHKARARLMNAGKGCCPLVCRTKSIRCCARQRNPERSGSSGTCAKERHACGVTFHLDRKTLIALRDKLLQGF